MQTIPVDVGRLGTMLCVVPPEPKVNRETGEIRKDRDDNPVWVVGVAVRQQGNRRMDAIEVAVPGPLQGIAEGMRVTVVDLVAIAWEIGGRSGTSFRASAVRPESPAPASSVPPRGAKSAGGEG
ncbi:hypothetical protein AB0P36_26340 [Streptomyces flavidovirens]|uniref:SCO3933 family regulatory protein n=1 Tax=Streptomyces flavidovirens TaxID=67298 RepID=UPI00342D0734